MEDGILLILHPRFGSSFLIMPDRPLILALGEILWDMLPAGKQLGGAPGNFAYHSAQLGGDARTVSAVGDDDLGREILARLVALGLDISQIMVDREHATGTVSVALNAGQPSYTIHENVAWDFIASTPALLELAGRADCVCFGTLAQRSEVSRRTIREALGRVRSDGLRIFDINLRQRYYDRDVIETSLGLANVLKINDDEIRVLGRLLGFAPAAGDIFSRFSHLKLIALTRGGKGSVLFGPGGEESAHPGYPAEPFVDAIGAGDAFTAALAMGWLRGHSLERINDDANRVAAFVCTRAGATPVIPLSLVQTLEH